MNVHIALLPICDYAFELSGYAGVAFDSLRGQFQSTQQKSPHRLCGLALAVDVTANNE